MYDVSWYTNACMCVLRPPIRLPLSINIPYGRKFSREPNFAVFAVDWRSTKIKSAK